MNQIGRPIKIEVSCDRRDTESFVDDSSFRSDCCKFAAGSLQQKTTRQPEELKFVRRQVDIIFRHNQISQAVEVEVFENTAPGKLVVGEFRFVRCVGEFEIAIVVEQNPFGIVSLIFSQIAFCQKRRRCRPRVGEEKVGLAVVVIIANRNPHWITVDA